MVLDRIAKLCLRVEDNSTCSLSTSLRTCLCRTQTISHTCSALSKGKFAVFGDALNSFVCFCLCFAFDASGAPWLDGMCVNSCLVFRSQRVSHRHSRLYFGSNSVTFKRILKNWLHDCVIALPTQHMILDAVCTPSAPMHEIYEFCTTSTRRREFC